MQIIRAFWSVPSTKVTNSVRPLPEAKHVFTHLIWQMTGFEILVEDLMESKLPHGPVPEGEGVYPYGRLFECVLPAHGFYLRHADRITFEDVSIEPTEADVRKPIVAEDAIQCVAKGTGKSLESVGDMQDGTMNLSRRKQIN